MQKLALMTTSDFALFCAVAMTSPANAQSAKDLVGNWTLVSITVDQDGKKLEPFGPKPRGMFIFDGTHFSVVIARDGLPKVASNNRMTETPEENKAITQGTLAFFGTYQATDSGQIKQKVLGSTYPNWTDTEQP